ncbi:MAG: AAA family ATPase [Planctomycetota bacterium]
MTSTALPSRCRPIIRLFVSSTFSDMKHERNALAANTFRRLEQLCQQHGFQFQAIDLRWGVSAEAGLDNRTMRICFNEVQRAQDISPEPNFLVLLGNRYGWRPVPEEISKSEYEKLTEAADSVAEQLLSDLEGNSVPKLLEEWYRPDENQVPPMYLLQPRTAHWKRVETVLRGLLNAAYPNAANWLDDLQDDACSWGKTPTIVRFQASATEQEIWKGFFLRPGAETHVLACFREIENQKEFSPYDVSDYFDVIGDQFDQSSADRQCALKAAIRKRLKLNPPLLIPFTRLKRADGKVVLETSKADTERFCDTVFEKLRPLIESQISQYWHGTAPVSAERAGLELAIEQQENERFGSERGGEESFVGRVRELQAILDYAAGDSRCPLVVHGVSGSGKTALLARASQEVAKTRRCVVRFIGVTPRGSEIRSLLSSLCEELRQDSPCGNRLSADMQELRGEFCRHLNAASAERPVILFLDALDQLADTNDGRMLNWLPERLPEYVKVIVSCVSKRPANDAAGQPYTELERRPIPLENFLQLNILSECEAWKLLFSKWLPRAGRTVSKDQQALIEEQLKFPHHRTPIHLKLLFEEVRQWHSWEQRATLGDNLHSLPERLIKRLSDPANHGELLVNRVLGYLSASRCGLAETELLEILFSDDEYRGYLNDVSERTRHELPVDATRIPIALWSRLRFDLAHYLTERTAPGANVLAFYHRQMAEWLDQNFGAVNERNWQPHERLARYFLEQSPWLLPADSRHGVPDPAGSAVPNARRSYETPWQLLKARAYIQAEELISSSEFQQSKAESELLFDLLQDFAVLGQMHPLSAESEVTFALLQQEGSVLSKWPVVTAQHLHNTRISRSLPGCESVAARLTSFRGLFPVLATAAWTDGTASRSVRWLGNHDLPVMTVDVCPISGRVVSASADGTLSCFSLRSAPVLVKLEFGIQSVRFAPAYPSCVVAGRYGHIAIVNLERQQVQRLQRLPAGINAMVVTDSGACMYLLSGELLFRLNLSDLPVSIEEIRRVHDHELILLDDTGPELLNTPIAVTPRILKKPLTAAFLADARGTVVQLENGSLQAKGPDHPTGTVIVEGDAAARLLAVIGHDQVLAVYTRNAGRTWTQVLRVLNVACVAWGTNGILAAGRLSGDVELHDLTASAQCNAVRMPGFRSPSEKRREPSRIRLERYETGLFAFVDGSPQAIRLDQRAVHSAVTGDGCGVVWSDHSKHLWRSRINPPGAGMTQPEDLGEQVDWVEGLVSLSTGRSILVAFSGGGLRLIEADSTILPAADRWLGNLWGSFQFAVECPGEHLVAIVHSRLVTFHDSRVSTSENSPAGLLILPDTPAKLHWELNGDHYSVICEGDNSWCIYYRVWRTFRRFERGES